MDGCREYRPVPGAESISLSLRNGKEVYFQIIYFLVISIYLHRRGPLSLATIATITQQSIGKQFCVMSLLWQLYLRIIFWFRKHWCHCERCGCDNYRRIIEIELSHKDDYSIELEDDGLENLVKVKTIKFSVTLLQVSAYELPLWDRACKLAALLSG
jgi:hypothetical protein